MEHLYNKGEQEENSVEIEAHLIEGKSREILKLLNGLSLNIIKAITTWVDELATFLPIAVSDHLQ